VAAAVGSPTAAVLFFLTETPFAHSIDSRYNHGVFFQISNFPSGQRAATLQIESRFFFSVWAMVLASINHRNL
jgi:hypothetical protein